MKYELICYCENDKFAKKAYSLIHNETESKNLGDITLVNEKEIADFNWMVGGSPAKIFLLQAKEKGQYGLARIVKTMKEMIINIIH